MKFRLIHPAFVVAAALATNLPAQAHEDESQAGPGAWEESAATNARSMKVAVAAGDIDEAFHAADFMVYADLQMGRDVAARSVIDEVMAVGGASARFTAPYAKAAMPARYALERGDWKAAAKLKPQESAYPFVEAITYYSRVLGAARSGDLGSARHDADKLEGFHRALLDAKNNYWATEVEIQQLSAAGWIALGDSDSVEALKFMRAAADLEDKNEKQIVMPGRVVPARELLGEMLLELKQPEAALKEFEASQKREPNRYRNYAGSARAAKMAGDTVNTAWYYRKLVQLTKDADTVRPELAVARKYAER